MKASHMTSSASKSKKNNLDYWRKNCFNCAYFRRIHILHDGKDDGSVRFQCTLKDEDVMPHKVDGCRKFEQGEPISESVNVETKNKSDVSSAKSSVSGQKGGVSTTKSGVSGQKGGVSTTKSGVSNDTSDITSDISDVTSEGQEVSE